MSNSHSAVEHRIIFEQKIFLFSLRLHQIIAKRKPFGKFLEFCKKVSKWRLDTIIKLNFLKNYVFAQFMISSLDENISTENSHQMQIHLKSFRSIGQIFFIVLLFNFLKNNVNMDFMGHDDVTIGNCQLKFHRTCRETEDEKRESRIEYFCFLSHYKKLERVGLNAETYLELFQTSMIEIFCLNQNPKYTSETS